MIVRGSAIFKMCICVLVPSLFTIFKFENKCISANDTPVHVRIDLQIQKICLFFYETKALTRRAWRT